MVGTIASWAAAAELGGVSKPQAIVSLERGTHTWRYFEYYIED